MVSLIIHWLLFLIVIVVLWAQVTNLQEARRRYQDEFDRLVEVRTQLLKDGKMGYEALTEAAEGYNLRLGRVQEILDALHNVNETGIQTIEAWNAEREELRAMLDKRIKREAGRRKPAGLRSPSAFMAEAARAAGVGK